MADTRSLQGRVPPQAVELEQAVLGALLIHPESLDLVVNKLRPKDFYKRAHQLIYEAIIDLYKKADPIDLLTVSEQLLKMGQLENVGGRVKVVELSEQVATAANCEYHAQIVREKAILRRLIDAAENVLKESYDVAAEPHEMLDRTEQAIFEISEFHDRRDIEQLKDLLPGTFDIIEELQKAGGRFRGIPTGFTELDDKLSGLHNGDLIVIAGRPSMGKTAFALNIAEHIAIREKKPAALFSLEMSKEQLVFRLLCSAARVDSHALRTGRLKSSEWPRLSAACGPLDESEIWIDDTPSMSILELRGTARQLKRRNNIGLVIVDYLQMMQGPANAESRQQEISAISHGLKALAKELEIPVLALSQLSRAPEQRGGDRRPQLADLRESGAIEQDADVVMFIYRPERYDIKKDKDGRSVENIAEVIISKQRNGPTGVVRLMFNKEYVRFENMAPGAMQEPVGPPVEEPSESAGSETPF